MANNSITLNALDKRIRSSLAYTNWVSRNKGPRCLRCGSSENLECHHLIDLYHVILDLWRFYGDTEEVFTHIIMYHDNDMLEGGTMCSACHKMRHPGRVLTASYTDINTDTWSVIPRMIKINPNHSSRDHRRGSIGLIAYQTLFGIGWNIINGHVDSRMLTIHRRRFAQLIGKKPSTSFNNSLDVALGQLQGIGIICGHHRHENEIELHLSKDYLDLMGSNPWFVPMNDVPTDSMCVLCLRLWLGMQSCRRQYFISLDKLKKHIGMTVQRKSAAIAAIRKALKHIPWAKMTEEESLHFTLSYRPPTPIRALRAILEDSLEQAK